MDKTLICIVFVMFAGCSSTQECARTPVTEPNPQEEAEATPNADKPPEMDEETRREYENVIRRHPPSPVSLP